MTLRSCLKSMRLRTLPLSLSGVVVGICLSSAKVAPGFSTVLFLLLTTCLLQVVSNLSNELGDTLHGTDTAARQGVHYSIMDGEMTVPEMKRLIDAMAVLCCICGLLMIFFSFGTFLAPLPIAFIVLGAAALAAAVRYTLGRNPYGYRGLGDVFVFIFFGLVSTLGAFFICSHSFDMLLPLLPAAAIGCFSVGVLNVNNIRDMKTDARTRTTVALKLGLRRARVYQTVLICAGWILMLAFTALTATRSLQWLHLATLPLFGLHLKGVWTRQDRRLDPMLPLLVMSTFLMSILFGLTFCLAQ